MFNTKAIKATILFTVVCVFGWIAHGVQTLAQIEITNEVYTAAQTDAKIVELAPTPGDYSTVSNRAMNAVQSDELGSDIETLLNDGLIDYFNDWLPNELDSIDENNPRYYKINQPFYLTNETVRINVDYGSYKLNYGYYELALDDNGFTMVGPMVAKGTSDVDTIWNLARVTELYLPRYIYASVPGYDESIDLWALATTNDVLDIVNRTTFHSITDGTNTLSANLDYEYEKVLTNTWVVNGIPYTTTTGYTYCSYFPPNPNENDMGYTLTLSEGSSWESGYYDLSIGAWYWRNKGTEENPDYQWESDSGGTTGLLPANGTSFDIDGFVGTYPIKRMETSKLALTNDIPPALQVVTPSTNAVKGTAADALATGTALYTGFTEWETDYLSGAIIKWTGTGWAAYLKSQPDFLVGDPIGDIDSTNLVWVSGITSGSDFSATRHLITPTKTSQLQNDGDGTNMFATVNQIPTRAVETNEYGDVQASITFRKVNEYGTPVDTEVKIGYADAFDTHNKLLVEGSYNGGEVYVSGRYGEGGIRILGGGSEAYPDEGGKIIIDGTNIVPVVFGAAQSIDTNYNDFAFVKDDGTIYYKVMEGVWSTVIGENYISGARLYSYSYGPTTNWTWYVTGGTSSSFRTFEAPLDATELKFRYNPSTTNKFYRGSNVARLGMVGNMIASNVVSLVTNINADVRIKGTFSQGTNTLATGIASHAEGGSTTAEGNYAHSEGNGTYARGLASHSEGLFTRATERASHSSGACALATNSWSFVWSGLERSPYYGSHGVSSFNVNPINGINGFYIGEQTLQQAIVASIMDTSLSNDIEVVYQNQDNSDAAMISDIVVTQAVTNHVPTIRTAVRDVVDNAIGNGMVNVTNHYSDWFFTGLPSGVTVTSLQYRNNQWDIQLSNGDHQSMNGDGDNSTSLLFLSSEWMESTGTGDVTADRFFQLQDRSMNILTTWGLTVPLSFPKPVPNKFREFRLRLVITAQPSSADYLNLHGAITNGVEETISFETEDGTFPSVTTISTNLYHFVETAPSIFYVEKKQLTPAPLF